MKRFIITPLAEQDLEAIGNYIAKDNPRRALSFIGELRSQCGKISKAPKAYRPREELGKGIRSCSHGKYVIFYTEDEGVVRIVRVLHSAMDIEARFDDEDDSAAPTKSK